jgi:hypothetical protein
MELGRLGEEQAWGKGERLALGGIGFECLKTSMVVSQTSLCSMEFYFWLFFSGFYEI